MPVAFQAQVWEIHSSVLMNMLTLKNKTQLMIKQCYFPK
jgi:hypothetical protein